MTLQSSHKIGQSVLRDTHTISLLFNPRLFTILLWPLFLILCYQFLPLEDSTYALLSAAISFILIRFLVVKGFKDLKNFQFVLQTTYFAFALRIVSVIIAWAWMVHFEGGDPFRGFTLDDSGYDRLGWGLAQNWHKSGSIFPKDLLNEGYFLRHQGTQTGFHYFTGIIYFFVGRHTIIVRIINAFLGAMIIPIINEIARKVYRSQTVAIRAIKLCAVFPPFLLYSSQHLKDTAVYFLVSFIIYRILKIVKGNLNIVKIIPIAFAMFLLFFLRNQTTFLLFGLILGFLLLRSYKFSNKYSIAFILIIILIGPVFQKMGKGFAGFNYYESLLYSLHLKEKTKGVTGLGGHIAWGGSSA